MIYYCYEVSHFQISRKLESTLYEDDDDRSSNRLLYYGTILMMKKDLVDSSVLLAKNSFGTYILPPAACRKSRNEFILRQ